MIAFSGTIIPGEVCEIATATIHREGTMGNIVLLKAPPGAVLRDYRRPDQTIVGVGVQLGALHGAPSPFEGMRVVAGDRLDLSIVGPIYGEFEGWIMFIPRKGRW